MTYQLSNYQLKQITKKLPPDIQAFKDKYPLSVYNVAEAWGLKPWPHGYIPEYIGIYYGDAPRGEDISFLDGKLRIFEVREPEEINVTKVSIDDEWAYIQIGKRVLLDRLGEVILPELLQEPQKILEILLAQCPS